MKNSTEVVKAVIVCSLVVLFLAFVNVREVRAEGIVFEDEIYQQIYDQCYSESIEEYEEQNNMEIDNNISNIETSATEMVDATDLLQDYLYPEEEAAEIPEVTVVAKAPVATKSSQVMTLTAYCTCSKCCGHSTEVTASGNPAQAWHTVAAGSRFTFGTQLYIPGLANTPSGGYFVVEDRGSKVGNSKLDICLSNHQEAKAFGTKHLEVFVC